MYLQYLLSQHSTYNICTVNTVLTVSAQSVQYLQYLCSQYSTYNSCSVSTVLTIFVQHTLGHPHYLGPFHSPAVILPDSFQDHALLYQIFYLEMRIIQVAIGIVVITTDFEPQGHKFKAHHSSFGNKAARALETKQHITFFCNHPHVILI